MKLSKVSGGYAGGFQLEHISFQVQKGKTYALLGLNGSGKSTLFKLIIGILKVSTGSIWINNKDVLKLNEKERAKLISYVPQYSHIIFDTSVLDVVLMGVTPYMKIFGTPNHKHYNEAYKSLKRFGIAHLADANYQELSGGQKQIVMIARALLQNGEYMILDEPESSLDLINKNEFLKTIKSIAKEDNKGCIISMHHPEYALNYCDHIIMIRDGKILELDVKNNSVESIEKYLANIYGDIKVMKYNEKFFVYYE